MMIRNKKLEEKLRQIMEQAVEEKLVAGVNLLVWEDGRELVYSQAGLADRENNKARTLFRVWNFRSNAAYGRCSAVKAYYYGK